jgi:hypothetical protein
VTQSADDEVINLLVERDGIATTVTLKNGLGLTVHNIAWGYDIGDEYAYVTTNISPDIEGASVDVFVTNDIESISDPESGKTLV